MKLDPRWNLSLLTLCLLLAMASLSSAEVSVRECIYPGPPNGEAHVLPADGQWRKIGTLKFDHGSASDYVVQAMVHLSEDNTPGSRVEYQFLLDGVTYGWYTRRIPRTFPTTQTLRTTIPDVSPKAGGHHELSIRARNLSSNDILYRRFWLSPLLVDGQEKTSSNTRLQQVTTQSGWTTLAETTVSLSSTKHVYLSAYTAVGGGTSQNDIEYRFLRNGAVLETFTDSVPDQFPDGNHFALIAKNVSWGTHTFTVQGRSPSGSSVTFGAKEIQIQTLPAFTVLDIDQEPSTPISVPSDGNWHTLGSTTQSINSLSSQGSYGIDGSGFGEVTYVGNLASETQLRFQLDTSGLTFEVGWLDVAASGGTELETLPSDWEQLGHGSSLTLRLQAKNLCWGAADLDVSDIKSQVLVLPDNTPYTFHSCASNPTVCCDNVASCEIYECVPGLTQTTKPSSRDCF